MTDHKKMSGKKERFIDSKQNIGGCICRVSAAETRFCTTLLESVQSHYLFLLCSCDFRGLRYFSVDYC